MPVDPRIVRERWTRIRGKKEECNLALTPESVAAYLERPEYELVQERIQESLNQFAHYRVDKGSFRSADPAGPGDLATCEGLEAFLVPAVACALPFSTFLHRFRGSEKNKTEQEKQNFIAAIVADIANLIDHWKAGQFSAQPYADEDKILQSLPPREQGRIKRIDITEAAAMACRVLIHLLTLKLRPSPEEREQGAFQEYIGSKLENKPMFDALKNSMEFLVRAFQKAETGADLGERIANARIDKEPGSGWSWTDHAGLPPMLFFTSAAVDAFAELDLYLIRPATSGELENGTQDEKQLLLFYNDNKTTLQHFELSVELARHWVQNTVLPDFSFGFGQYKESGVDYYSILNDARYQPYGEKLKREGLKHPPVVFYNNLYGLQILLWSWADWDEEGKESDDDARNKINRALAQLVYNYDTLPGVKEVLSDFPYQFYLPGKNFLVDDARCMYLDSGFLPLLTRLLVLFVVYGVGDRNLLEPVIRNLYVELLQNRNRNKLAYSALWSESAIEVFSTQRAIQALSFYYAYARGKELVTRGGKGASVAPAEDLIVLRNKTGRPLFLEAVSDDKAAAEPAAKPPAPPAPAPDPFTAKTFGDYCQQRFQVQLDPTKFSTGEKVELVTSAIELGRDIINDINRAKMRETGAGELILNELVDIGREPAMNERVRNAELELLKRQYEQLRRKNTEERP